MPYVKRPTCRARAGAALSGAVLVSSLMMLPAGADPAPGQRTSAGSGDQSAFAPADAIVPRPGPYGSFVDTYTRNAAENLTPESNPAVGVLHRMLDYWTPGESWNDGTVLNQELHDANIRRVVEITNARTPEEGREAWIGDRRHQSYSLVEGLGEDAAAFYELSNAGTTITEVPDDAMEVKYSDEGNANGTWADADSPLGSVVELVNTVRGNYATSNHSKMYYQYMRPFRWSDDVEVVPELVVRIVPEEDALSDGGFPSGHTNAAFLAGLGLAAAVPEHYGDLMLTAAELGYGRVVSGMHSPLDVIGGRILATGLAGATLADPANEEIQAQALADAGELLEPVAALETDRDAYRTDLARYLELTTFDLPTVAEPGDDPRVPEGAESLLRSRFPYLDDEQVRWVLHSTALESGLPVVDDDEGWGRTNLFAASHGYGAFDRDVVVDKSAADGGFAAADVWINDITGPGGLTKTGSGELTLAGENSFAGGVLVDDGAVVATRSASTGTGDVELTGGRLVDAAATPVLVGGDFAQAAGATLELTQDSPEAPALRVNGEVTLAGTLEVDVTGLAELPDELLVLSHPAGAADGEFAEVVVVGGPAGAALEASYLDDGVYLTAVVDAPTPPGAEPTPDPVVTEPPAQGAAPVPTEPAAAEPARSGSLAATGADAATAAVVASALLAVGALMIGYRRKAALSAR